MAKIDQETVNEAVRDVQTRKFASIRAAARHHHLSHASLQRRLRGGVSSHQRHKEQSLLSEEQEKLLQSWILEAESNGHPVTNPYVRELAGLISNRSGGPATVGQNWVSRFIKRHPAIKSKVGRKIDALRIQNTTPAALTEWFALFKRTQQTHNVKPQHIWNMDETGIALGVCKNQWVIGKTSTSKAYVKSPEDREWVSIIEAISADGVSIRPVVIFKGKSLQTSWFLASDCPDWLYANSENAWTSNDIGYRWLCDVFLPETQVANETRILLVDGHSSHASPQFMAKCIKNNVKVIYLIPHASHVLQPLDLACFSVIKSRYREQIANLSRFKDLAPIKKVRFI
jgi:hypothetical protein